MMQCGTYETLLAKHNRKRREYYQITKAGRIMTDNYFIDTLRNGNFPEK